MRIAAQTRNGRVGVGLAGLVAVAAVVTACAAGSTGNDADTSATDPSLESGKVPAPPAPPGPGTSSSTPGAPPGPPPPPPPPPPPAGGCVPPVPGGACDTLPQCGCSGATKCDVIDPTGRTGCVADGPAGTYAACSATTDCRAGLACIDAVCKPYCDTAADCGGDRTCVPVYYGGTKVPGFSSCTAACDLATPSATCGSGTTCLAGSASTSDCAGPAGSGTGPGGCPSGPLDCAPGWVCMTGTTDCRKWCHLGGPATDCATGQTCAALPSGVVTIGGVTFGVCG